MSPFGVVCTYSNPISRSFVASAVLLATLIMNWSFVFRNRLSSRLMYIMVLFTSRCPSLCWSLHTSGLSWYHMVA